VKLKGWAFLSLGLVYIPLGLLAHPWWRGFLIVLGVTLYGHLNYLMGLRKQR
jgi:hypothetical protein